MNKEYCRYETAALVWVKGFNPPMSSHNYYWTLDGKVIHPYDWFSVYDFINIIHAPTQAELQTWIRTEKEIHIEIYSNASGWGWILTKLNGTGIKEITDDQFFDCYEDALEEGIKQALNKIK